MALHPAVAAVRLAVRRELGDLATSGRDGPGGTVLVASSGGADSLALLAATLVEGHKRGLRVVGVTVDHGLQDGSTAHAAAVVAQMSGLGADRSESLAVSVDPHGRGVEAGAREARYAALVGACGRFDGAAVLLGHTRDDQAETVLLGLTRGSGGRSLAGMRRVVAPFRRPLLDLTRQQTEAACRAEGIAYWSDPHNADPRFTRARIRHRVLPVLEEQLGPGVAAALARTADLLAEDADALDRIAGRVHDLSGGAAGLDLAVLGSEPRAVALRVLRLAALAAGCPPSELFRVHVLALADVALGPAGPRRGRRVQLPGHVTAYREGNRLRFGRTAVPG